MDVYFIISIVSFLALILLDYRNYLRNNDNSDPESIFYLNRISIYVIGATLKRKYKVKKGIRKIYILVLGIMIISLILWIIL